VLLEEAHAFQAPGVVGLGAGVVQGGVALAEKGGREVKGKEGEDGLDEECFLRMIKVDNCVCCHFFILVPLSAARAPHKHTYAYVSVTKIEAPFSSSQAKVVGTPARQAI